MTSAQPPPLPIRPRPRTGEPTVSYLRRLARANHLRPRVLDRYLRDGPGSPIRLERLAALAGRSLDALTKALAEHFPGPDPPSSIRQRRARAALFATIRRDAANNPGRSVRFLADRHGVHRRTIHTALNNPIPPPRRAQSRRGSRLDQHQAVIDAMLARPSRPRHRTTIQEVYDHLTQNLKVTVSFSAVSAYVRARRKHGASQNSGEAVERSEPDGNG